MLKNIDPIKLGILKVTKETVSHLKPVTSSSIFVSSSTEFHPEGLFSNEIFGLQGSEERSTRRAYIDLKLPIIYPTLYELLVKAKSSYKDIMEGTSYAIWDTKEKNFVLSDFENGRTGYEFFISHLHELKIEDTGSVTRLKLIQLLEFAGKQATMDKLIVLEAGYRDYMIGANGRATIDEINNLYQRVISATNLIPDKVTDGIETMDSVRATIQRTVQEINEYADTTLFGKNKFINSSWAARRLQLGTRNVITSLQPDDVDVDSPGAVGPNDAVVGIYQFMKGNVYAVAYNLKNGFAANLFTGDSTHMVLTNKETLKKETVPYDDALYNNLMSTKSINKIINNSISAKVRMRVLDYGNHYLGMVYEDDKQGYKLFQDTDELPEGYNPDHIRPMKLIDLLYDACHELAQDSYATITRYPVLHKKSTYPAKIFLRVTMKSQVRYKLDENNEKTTLAYAYPILSTGFHESISIQPLRLAGLNADFDGDVISCNFVITKEAKKEIKELMASPEFYTDLDGTMAASNALPNLELILKSITGVYQ